MTGNRPELIFLTGPQAGERQMLMDNVVTIGRSPQADINLREPATSRQQMRFQLTGDGWILENLSANGTWVNGRRYRGSKQILLETGDVVGVGEQTQILFVGPDDDPEEALKQYRSREAARAAAAAPKEQAPEQPEAGEPVPADREKEEPVDEEARARAAKTRKYIIGFAVYAGLMVLLIVLLATLKNGGDPGEGDGPVSAGGQPPVLSPEQIEQDLEEKWPPEAPNPVVAERMLEQARAYYESRRDAPGNLYRAVKHFKLHLAYRPEGQRMFEEARDRILYNQARDQLVEEVSRLYRKAYIDESAGRYWDAERTFERIRRMLPVKQGEHPETDSRIFDNIIRHITYVRRQRGDE